MKTNALISSLVLLALVPMLLIPAYASDDTMSISADVVTVGEPVYVTGKVEHVIATSGFPVSLEVYRDGELFLERTVSTSGKDFNQYRLEIIPDQVGLYTVDKQFYTGLDLHVEFTAEPQQDPIQVKTISNPK